MPPLLIQVGTDELLLDDARRYAEAAVAQVGEVLLAIYEGLHHVFQRSVTELTLRIVNRFKAGRSSFEFSVLLCPLRRLYWPCVSPRKQE